MHAVKKLVELGAHVNQALPVGEIAHVNEELDIEEYLKSKMGVNEGSGEREDKQDIAPTNRATGPSFQSTLEKLRSIGNTIKREGLHFLAVGAAAFGSNLP